MIRSTGALGRVHRGHLQVLGQSTPGGHLQEQMFGLSLKILDSLLSRRLYISLETFLDMPVLSFLTYFSSLSTFNFSPRADLSVM
jgi:hypothetical protein